MNKHDRMELSVMLGAVDRMAYHMKKKLRAKARQGYTGGLLPENRGDVAGLLRSHVDELIGGAERQAVDVGNLAMMLWVLGGENKPGLIHWASTRDGICFRRDVGIDVTSAKCGETTITHSAMANHPGNVTCKTCRAFIRERRKK